MMSKVIKSVGVALAAAAVVGVGVGAASAGTVHEDAAAHSASQAKAAQVVCTKSFQVSTKALPDNTYLVVQNIQGTNIGGLDSGPTIGTTMQANSMQDYEVTWFVGKDNDVKVQYDLYKFNGLYSYDTGKSVELDFDVNMWRTATATVVSQNGLEALASSGDPAGAYVYVPHA